MSRLDPMRVTYLGCTHVCLHILVHLVECPEKRKVNDSRNGNALANLILTSLPIFCRLTIFCLRMRTDFIG